MTTLDGVVRHWAARKPDAPALIHAQTGEQVAWHVFERRMDQAAAALAGAGLEPGEFLAAMLPFSFEHIFLAYGCFAAGAIHAPLDLRLKPAEVVRSINQVRAAAFFGPPAMAEVVKQACPFVRVMGPLPAAGWQPCPVRPAAAQVIFTTGSTGSPKPALLSHGNILAQNRALGEAFFHEDQRVLVNLPASHVGGQAEELMTALYCGGTAVVQPVFDAAGSLAAIERFRVGLIGQIPAMYEYEWRLADYARYDLASLETAVYGGQSATPEFLERLAAMAPRIGTGLGLTETAGFCTYTGAGPLDGLGRAAASYPVSIRRPMRDDGQAGEEVAPGQTGHICFRGPQTFLGYVGEPEATARAISRDGWLYTGDLGFQDAAGLHFTARAKWVIKSAGYQVYPADIENHITTHPKVHACGVVGVPHKLRGEAIVAFVEKEPGQDLAAAELRAHARALASYMRPLRWVILEPGQLPLNRVVKTDYVRLQEMAAARNR
jgi:acyl-CoA synthetase (AMP-forming)/AMP-acid ligase II